MLDQGLALYISSNLARELSEEELKTLSRFWIIQTSCDTDDLKLFKELRRGGDFRTLIYNMGKIRSHAVREGIRPPEFWWHCVLSDRTIGTLESYVTHGLAQGVKLFNFINLVKHVDVESMRGVRHVTELPREQLEQIPLVFSRVFQTIRNHGATYICDSLLETVKARLDCELAAEEKEVALPAHVTRQRPGMTRDCVDPWIYAKVAASGNIIACCRGDRSVGSLSDWTLADILNGSQMRAFRKQLLTGNLEEVCLTCNIRGWTSIKSLKRKVVLALSLGRFVPLAGKLGILLPLLYRIRRTTAGA